MAIEIQPESAQLFVVFVLVAGALWDFHNHSDDIWESGAGIEIVQGGFQGTSPPSLSGGIAKLLLRRG